MQQYMMTHPHLVNIQLLDHLVPLSRTKNIPKLRAVKIHAMVSMWM